MLFTLICYLCDFFRIVFFLLGPRFTSVSAEVKNNLVTVGEYILYFGSRAKYQFSKSSVPRFAKDLKKDVKMIDKSSHETRDIVLKLLNPKPELRYVYDLRMNGC